MKNKERELITLVRDEMYDAVKDLLKKTDVSKFVSYVMYIQATVNEDTDMMNALYVEIGLPYKEDLEIIARLLNINTSYLNTNMVKELGLVKGSCESDSDDICYLRNIIIATRDESCNTVTALLNKITDKEIKDILKVLYMQAIVNRDLSMIESIYRRFKITEDSDLYTLAEIMDVDLRFIFNDSRYEKDDFDPGNGTEMAMKHFQETGTSYLYYGTKRVIGSVQNLLKEQGLSLAIVLRVEDGKYVLDKRERFASDLEGYTGNIILTYDDKGSEYYTTKRCSGVIRQLKHKGRFSIKSIVTNDKNLVDTLIVPEEVFRLTTDVIYIDESINKSIYVDCVDKEENSKEDAEKDKKCILAARESDWQILRELIKGYTPSKTAILAMYTTSMIEGDLKTIEVLYGNLGSVYLDRLFYLVDVCNIGYDELPINMSNELKEYATIKMSDTAQTITRRVLSGTGSMCYDEVEDILKEGYSLLGHAVELAYINAIVNEDIKMAKILYSNIEMPSDITTLVKLSDIMGVGKEFRELISKDGKPAEITYKKPSMVDVHLNLAKQLAGLDKNNLR